MPHVGCPSQAPTRSARTSWERGSRRPRARRTCTRSRRRRRPASRHTSPPAPPRRSRGGCCRASRRSPRRSPGRHQPRNEPPRRWAAYSPPGTRAAARAPRRSPPRSSVSDRQAVPRRSTPCDLRRLRVASPRRIGRPLGIGVTIQPGGWLCCPTIRGWCPLGLVMPHALLLSHRADRLDEHHHLAVERVGPNKAFRRPRHVRRSLVVFHLILVMPCAGLVEPCQRPVTLQPDLRR